MRPPSDRRPEMAVGSVCEPVRDASERVRNVEERPEPIRALFHTGWPIPAACAVTPAALGVILGIPIRKEHHFVVLRRG